jgi:hypothetical protein
MKKEFFQSIGVNMNAKRFTLRLKMIHAPIKIANLLVLLILFLIFLLLLSCHQNKSSQFNKLNCLLNSNNLKLDSQVPLEFSTYHVQGLDVTERFYFVTSVDTNQDRAWLFKIDRDNASLITQKELTDGTLIHPGGLQFDGRYLWVPNAEYKRQSRTVIYGLDPNTLEICTWFSVGDHIGAVASDGKNLVYGVNWDALHFYTWDIEGHQLKKIDSPTSIAYQDIKYYAGKLLCGGNNGDISALDIIDPENWALVKRINLPKDKWRSKLTREGMAFDGNLYFLPDDGPDSRILIFGLN